MDYPITQLPVMDVEEVDDIPFDFTSGLIASDVIQAFVIEVDLERGTDDDPQSLAVGAAVLGRIVPTTREFVADAAGRVVLQRFSAAGRAPRNTYCLRCVAVLASGRQLVAAGHMRIRKL